MEFQNGDLKLEATDISLDIERIERDLDKDDSGDTVAVDKYKDRMTRIYACATMWHEEKNEMNHLVGSILRLDRDQCAIRVTQRYYEIHIEDYYELESESQSSEIIVTTRLKRIKRLIYFSHKLQITNFPFYGNITARVTRFIF